MEEKYPLDLNFKYDIRMKQYTFLDEMNPKTLTMETDQTRSRRETDSDLWINPNKTHE